MPDVGGTRPRLYTIPPSAPFLSTLASAVLNGDLPVPGELFVEIALRIKSETRHPVFIMGITNGYVGYLPTREAYRADIDASLAFTCSATFAGTSS